MTSTVRGFGIAWGGIEAVARAELGSRDVRGAGGARRARPARCRRRAPPARAPHPPARVRRAAPGAGRARARLGGRASPSGLPVHLGRQRGQHPAVLVVGREEVEPDRLGPPRAVPHRHVLVELPDAPFEHDGHGILVVGEPREAERLDERLPHDVALGVARDLEHALAARQHPPVLIARHHARAGGREEVLQQLEHVPESAPRAADRLVCETRLPVVVERSGVQFGQMKYRMPSA